MKGVVSRVWLTETAAALGSLATLFCWALPVTLVSLGLGSSLAVLAASPAFVLIRPVLEHKAQVVALVGALLATNAWLLYRWLPRRACPRGEVCPLPPARGARALFWFSASVFAVSLFLSYGLVPVLEFWE